VPGEPQETLAIRDFPGLNTKGDRDDIPSGASVIQVNLMSTRPGVLQVRPGMREVKFEEQ
jgi:hypothetical protein